MNAEREQYLMDNMKRWRKVAELVHAETCKARHDCHRAVEQLYHDLIRIEEAGR
jgi:hypothetical protein